MPIAEQEGVGLPSCACRLRRLGPKLSETGCGGLLIFRQNSDRNVWPEWNRASRRSSGPWWIRAGFAAASAVLDWASSDAKGTPSSQQRQNAGPGRGPGGGPHVGRWAAPRVEIAQNSATMANGVNSVADLADHLGEGGQSCLGAGTARAAHRARGLLRLRRGGPEGTGPPGRARRDGLPPRVRRRP